MDSIIDYITDQILETATTENYFRKCTLKCSSYFYNKFIEEVEERSRLTWLKSDFNEDDLPITKEDFKFITVNGIEISIIVNNSLDFPILVITLKQV